MFRKLLFVMLFLCALVLVLFIPTGVNIARNSLAKFDHKTPVKVGFGLRANQEFPFYPAAAIMYRRRTPRLQSERAYRKWLEENPAKAEMVRQYQSFLNDNNVGEIIPMRELLQGCADNPLKPELAFDVPPKALWPNIVPTLKWFDANARPIIGKVRLYHGYRNPDANKACGSRSPVHPANSAIDFVPMEMHDPAKIERLMCSAFRAKGKTAKIGMGFYGVGLIHIDTRGYRSWGPDTRSATSPCKV